MGKYIYDPTNGWWYELVGDYYIPFAHTGDPTTKPDCHTPESHTEVQHVGTWGNRHLTYLRKHSPAVYREFLINGTLHSYLAKIDRTAQEMYNRLIQQLANTYGITEDIKAKDQMEWVRTMNAIRHIAEEIVLSEVIYP